VGVCAYHFPIFIYDQEIAAHGNAVWMVAQIINLLAKPALQGHIIGIHSRYEVSARYADALIQPGGVPLMLFSEEAEAFVLARILLNYVE
jgi:hypothetical protein